MSEDIIVFKADFCSKDFCASFMETSKFIFHQELLHQEDLLGHC